MERASIRLLPRSGPDPDWRDAVNQRACDRMMDYDARIVGLEREIDRLRGERAYTTRARRVALRRERQRLIPLYNEAVLDFGAGLVAGLNTRLIENGNNPDTMSSTDGHQLHLW